MSFQEKVQQAAQQLQQQKLEARQQAEKRESLRQACIQERKDLYVAWVVQCGLPEDAIEWTNDPGDGEQLRFSIAVPGLPGTEFVSENPLRYWANTASAYWTFGATGIYAVNVGDRSQSVKSQAELEALLVDRAAQHALLLEDPVYIVDLDDTSKDLAPIERFLYVIWTGQAPFDIAFFSKEEIEEAQTEAIRNDLEWSPLTYRQFNELRERLSIRESDPERVVKAIAQRLVEVKL